MWAALEDWVLFGMYKAANIAYYIFNFFAINTTMFYFKLHFKQGIEYVNRKIVFSVFKNNIFLDLLD